METKKNILGDLLNKKFLEIVGNNDLSFNEKVKETGKLFDLYDTKERLDGIKEFENQFVEIPFGEDRPKFIGESIKQIERNKRIVILGSEKVKVMKSLEAIGLQMQYIENKRFLERKIESLNISNGISSNIKINGTISKEAMGKVTNKIIDQQKEFLEQETKRINKNCRPELPKLEEAEIKTKEVSKNNGDVKTIFTLLYGIIVGIMIGFILFY